MILKAIPNHDKYFAGEDGHIYSLQPRGIGKIAKGLRRLKENIQYSGKYFVVSIKENSGLIKTKRVHRLVCAAFNGLPSNEQHDCSHLDGNWKNNKPNNLVWESRSQNHNRKKEHGTDDLGVRNSRAKIDIKTLRKIRKLLAEKEMSHQKIGNILGLRRVFITKIANGYRYKGQGL